MYSELLMLQRGIRIAFIGLCVVAGLTCDAKSSPIDVKFHAPSFMQGLERIIPTFKGSGVVINKNTVLTAFHNIEFPTQGSGTWFTDVKVLAYIPEKDICVIEYPTEGQKYSRLAPEPPKVGDRVFLIARYGTYKGTWDTSPHYDDQMSIKFDGKRPKIGDSGGGVYSETGLVGIFLGYSGWVDGPKGESSRIASWTTLKAFGIPVSGESAPVKPITDELLPLPGTEDGKAPTKGRDATKEAVSVKIPAEEPKKEVNNEPRRAIGRSTETDNEHNHTGPPDPEPSRRRGSSLNNRGQRRRPGNEQSGSIETGTASASTGASLPPTAPNKGSGSSTEDGDMLEMLLTAALGAAGIGVTGGTGAAIYFGVKGATALYRRRKKRKPDTGINTLKEQVEEVLGRKADGFPHIPGRKVDEIGELLQLAELEGYDPLMGSTFGLFMQDEINQLLARKEVKEEHKDIVRKLYNSTMDRLNSAAPLVKGQ